MPTVIATHSHSVVDADHPFMIDPITKVITEGSNNLTLAQHAKNSERFTFTIPDTVIEGHDMTACNSVMIHFLNIGQLPEERSTGVYEVTDLAVDGDSVNLSWLVGSDATRYAGGLIFSIHFACIADDGSMVYNFPTLAYSKITVGSTVWNSGTIAHDYPDILAQFNARIAELEVAQVLSGGAVFYNERTEASANASVEVKFGSQSELLEKFSSIPKERTMVISASGQFFKVTAVSSSKVTMTCMGGIGISSNGESGVMDFVSTFAELKAATLANVTPIVLAYGVTIEATERLTFHAGTTLIGNGATIKRAAGHEDRVIYLHANCRVQDLIIDGNRTAMVSPKWENTREVSTSAGCVIENVTINNGNEAIVVFGDNCVVTNCNINNCAGNGIHFTGSNNVRVENCRVINANLRTDGSIGHEDGCIIWSDDCDHIVCSNNWCEGGISGFGSIDDAHNSHVKLIGNTVKNCTRAIDLCYWNKAPHDIAISNNTFIDSGMIDLYKQNNQIFVPGNILVNGNLFINTDAKFYHVTDVTMIGNIFKNGSPMFVRCARVSIANNIVNNAVNDASDGIIARQCVNVTVDGNYVRAHREVLSVGYSTGVTVRGNNIRNVYSPSNTDYCINCDSVKNLIFDGNTVVLYRKGMSVPAYASITNNVILCASSDFNSLMLSNSRTNVIICNNRINGGKSFAVVADSVIENNGIGADDDVFVSVKKAFTGRSVDLPAKVTKGDEFAFTIVPNEGHALPEIIYITNNGIAMDVNEYEYDNTTGNVLIHCVCGDIVITDGTEVGPDPDTPDPDPDTPDTPTTSYTNLVPTSIDTDGKVYNGTGYMNGKRLSSSGAVKDLSTSSVTGFIKAKAGDVVRLGGVVLANDPSNCYIAAYDSNFGFIGAKVVTGSAYGTDPATIVWDGTICTYTLANVSTIAYIRINAVCDDAPHGADMIVTVNEEITK